MFFFLFPASPHFDQAKRIPIYGVLVFQIDHQPFLAVSFPGLAVNILQFRGKAGEHGFHRFFFLLPDNDQHGKIRLSGIYRAKALARLFKFDIPSPFPVAGTEFYFFLPFIFIPDFRTKFSKNGIPDIFAYFIQCRLIAVIQQIHHTITSREYVCIQYPDLFSELYHTFDPAHTVIREIECCRGNHVPGRTVF